jgi:predicted ATPase
VGRDHDMAQLKDIFAGLEAERGQTVIVSGEAGIGKSRLLSELKRDIESREKVHWLEGRCLAYTSSVPYGPFLRLIRNHVDRCFFERFVLLSQANKPLWACQL